MSEDTGGHGEAWMQETSHAGRRLRLRYDGSCVVCGRDLPRGSEALYDAAAHTVRCLTCAEAPAAHPSAPIDAGVVGSSARREFERRHTAREARVKGQVGERIGRILLAITDDPQSTRAWERGARGEEKLAAAIAGVPSVVVLHDRRVPGTRGNIDHVVLAPAGVFVVDTKRYDGMVRVRDRGGWFRSDERLYVGRRDCSHLADGMAWQVAAVVGALTAAGVEMPPVVPVLCFIDAEWPLIRPPDTFRGVRLEGPGSLRKLIARGDALDEAAIGRLAAVLAAAQPPK